MPPTSMGRTRQVVLLRLGVEVILKKKPAGCEQVDPTG